VTPTRRETVLRVLVAAPTRRFHAVELLALTHLPWGDLKPELDALVRDGWVASGPSVVPGASGRHPRVWWLAPLPGREQAR
jgi:hypothetical protein